jgi:hypothetical protein
MAHDDFAFEPIRGLPGRLPEGEHILWQGAPDWRSLAREAFATRWVMGYFVIVAVWRAATLSATPAQAVAAALPFLLAGALTVAILSLMAWVIARAAVYTLTNRRLVMRIGAALPVTFNFPFVQIEAADLDLRKTGIGTIALRLTPGNRVSYLVAWPHVRPWRIGRPEPALRCIRDAANVAGMLSEAAEARLNEPRVERSDARVAVAAE